MALLMFEESAGKRAIRHQELLKLIEESLRRPDVKQVDQRTPWQQAKPILEELREKRILIPLNSECTAHVFPHRSIAEYLTASALADRATEGRLWEFVDAKAWDPDWEQVVLFLAGRQSRSPDALQRLLQLLTNEAKDDVFRHRLAVAAQCLCEIPSNRRSVVSAEIDRITETGFFLWWHHKERDTDSAIPQLRRSLTALGSVNGRVQGAPLLHWASRRLGAWASPTLLALIGH